MADRSTFTPAEWSLLLESVMMAGIAVTAAEPSGLLGVLKEGMATSGTLMRAREDASANALVKAVAASFETAEGRSAARDGLKGRLEGARPADVTARCLERLRQARALLEEKAPDDAPAFKDWLLRIGRHTAEAAKEGGVLGFGGVAVSEKEQATLAEISAALGLKD
jgi:hypothetical protein